MNDRSARYAARMRHGFDLSEFNPPKLIPWHTRDFGCIRLTTGLKLDARADEHIRRASGAGVHDLAGYAYLKGSSPGDAQARCLLDRAHTLETSEHVEPMPLAIDIEDPFQGPPWPRELYAQRLIECVEWLVANVPRRRRLLYVSPAFWAVLVKAAPHVGALAPMLLLWLADWTKPANVPVHWTHWTIWQHEVTEIAPGVPIDHDVFDGSAEDWRALLCPPDPHDELGGIVTAVRGATGRGVSVEDFVPGDVEGPRFDR